MNDCQTKIDGEAELLLAFLGGWEGAAECFARLKANPGGGMQPDPEALAAFFGIEPQELTAQGG